MLAAGLIYESVRGVCVRAEGYGESFGVLPQFGAFRVNRLCQFLTNV